MSIPSRHARFTRQQIARMTAIGESTLNFWMREGVLRSVEGGGGKGHHRRFSFEEVNLAALLERLRRFGISIDVLRFISNKFHEALDYYDGIGISEEEHEALSTLSNSRKDVLKDGFVTFMATRESDFPGRPRYQWHDREDIEAVRYTWDQIVEWWREGKTGYRYPDKLVALAGSLDPTEYREKSFLAEMIKAVPEKIWDEANYVFKDDLDDWQITPDNNLAARSSDAFIALNISAILYPIWSGDQ